MSEQEKISQMLQQAIALHGNGEVNEAKFIYMQILNNEPRNFDALHLLGVIAYEEKEYSLASDLIAKSISIYPNNPDFYFHYALVLQSKMDLKGALSSYDAAINLNPDFAVAYFNRGNILKELNQFKASALDYGKAISLNPNFSEAYLNLGASLLELNQTESALDSYDKAIKIKSNLVYDYFNFGNLLLEQKKFAIAISIYDKVIATKQDFVDAYLNKGVAQHGLNQLEDAIHSYDKAIYLKADFSEAFFNRGIALQELKQDEAAVASYDKAISIKSDLTDAYLNRGAALQRLKQYEYAKASYEKAILIKPNFVEALNNLGNIYLEQKQFDEAILNYSKAISIQADYAEAYSNRGNALQEKKQFDEAIVNYDKAISIKMDYAEAYSNRGNALREVGQLVKSRESYLRALEIDPNYFLARWAKAFLSIQHIFSEVVNLEETRAQLIQDLQELDSWFTPDRMKYAFDVVGSVQPFYLAYQELNNREILCRYGHLCNRLLGHWQQSKNLQCTKINNIGRIKIGIVGQQIHNHSVWNAITKGWLLNLDPSRFELYIFYLGNINDDQTKLAQTIATSFYQNQPSWIEAILNEGIEVLIYPELGMDPTTAKLANLRLAPIQIATWGHPETTGLPTIDYYLSAELFEPLDAQNSYSETLVKLPNLGCCYYRLEVDFVEPDFIKLGIDTNEPILICPGAPFKYAPQHDWIFIEICRRLTKCKLVFFNQQINWTSILKERLRKLFKLAGLDIEKYVIFIPFLKKDEFYGLMNRASVYMDTIGFSGFNTAMEAIDCVLPIVTKDGLFMRGRLASGILKRMGITDLIAGSDEEYINLVVRLIQDKKYYDEVRQRIIKCREILFNDLEPIHAFEDFIISKCRDAI